MKYSIEEWEPVCANCHYYYQHHVQYDGIYVPAHCGHCACGRIKHRKPGESCERFVFRRKG